MGEMENQVYNSPLAPENISRYTPSGTATILKAPFGGLGASLPNLLLIAGNGRNVGKTTLACKIIQHLSQKEKVLGLKISPHFHSFNEADVVIQSKHFIIINEKLINSKDSSLMLQSGAKLVYYVMVKPEYFKEAIEQLIRILPNDPIICESGGLHEQVSPGLFLMVKRKGEEIVKTHLLQYSPTIVNNDGKNFDFDIRKIEFKNNKFSLKN